MKKIISAAVVLTMAATLFAGAALAKPHGGSGAGKSGRSPVHAVKSDGSPVKNVKAVVKEKKGDIKKERVKKKVEEGENKSIRAKIRERVKVRTEKQVKKQIQALKDIEGHWARDSIIRMQSLGLVSGYADGTFKPDDKVTEAEVIVLLMRLVDDEEVSAAENTESAGNGEETEAAEKADEDGENQGEAGEEREEEAVVDSETGELSEVPVWARGAVKKAHKMGMLNWNRFHSHVQASRAQSAVWIAKALDLEPVDTSNMPFKDGVLISPEDAGYIMALVNEGLIAGTSEGQFNPNGAITRAEIVVIMDRILQEGSEADEDGSTAEEGEKNEGIEDTGSDDTDVDVVDVSDDTGVKEEEDNAVNK
ncbi:hypothetical protein JOC37_001954 [Desulfohalotomaculum tongense]|uniref:S-layer homology domain-containing protein n=1 Tax=Desulforadius tongensis TaxID=1216062 RepID=UPI0019598A92|nr:S-layer homology domain-containing protein [Desulforadius tongensis]MBM7855557.1 hypothetical protein [Desulforadius tongensis]